MFDAFNDLPLAVKLGVTTAGAIGLLAVLAWIGLAALDQQRVLDASVAASENAERAGRRGLAAVVEMRLAATEMQAARDAATLQQAADRAASMGRRVGRLLEAMKGESTDAAMAGVVERTTKTLTDYQDKLAHEAELRRAALAAFARFQPLRTALATQATALRDALSHEWLLPDLAAQAQSDFAALLTAADAATTTALTLRTATGSDQAAAAAAKAEFAAGHETLSAARTEMQQRAAALGGLPVTPGTADIVKALAEAADALGAGAQAALDSASAAAAYGFDQTQPANKALAGKVDGAISPFVDAAEDARKAAIDALEKARFRLRALSGGAILMLLVLGAIFIASITRPIRAMTRAMQRIASGDTSQQVGFQGRRDEVGRMAAALETLRGAVGRAFMQGEMIEQLPLGVMTAEPEAPFRVTYVNAASRVLLAPLEGALPVPVASLVGQSVDVFHARPEHVRAILSHPERLPHRATVSVGGATLELTISALRAADGSFSGRMLCWRDRSAQERLSARFEQSVVGIAHEVGQSAEAMAATAETMSGAAGESGAQLQRVATASQGATGHVQAVASSAEQLASSVREIAQQVSESARIAGGAVAEAEATDRTVAGLADAAARIGDVVRLISDIAGRTNLLALNATIEAARAGEAGRGFAVVAGEVKTLATQTARATEEIGSQITAIQQETRQAVTALRSIGETIRRMNEIATMIAGAVEQQGAATREIARAVQQAAGGTADVDSTIAHVGDSVRRTGAQAGEVVSAARALTDQSATLAREVGEFLASLKAA